MKTVISTPNAPGAIGPYSQGYAFGDLVITSGQIPVDPATGAIPHSQPRYHLHLTDIRQFHNFFSWLLWFH